MVVGQKRDVGFGWTMIVHMGRDIDRLTIVDRPFTAWADQCEIFKGLFQCVNYLFVVVVVVDVDVDVVVGACHDSDSGFIYPANTVKKLGPCTNKDGEH